MRGRSFSISHRLAERHLEWLYDDRGTEDQGEPFSRGLGLASRGGAYGVRNHRILPPGHELLLTVAKPLRRAFAAHCPPCATRGPWARGARWRWWAKRAVARAPAWPCCSASTTPPRAASASTEWTSASTMPPGPVGSRWSETGSVVSGEASASRWRGSITRRRQASFVDMGGFGRLIVVTWIRHPLLGLASSW